MPPSMSITPSNLSKTTTGKTPQQWWSEMGNGGSPQAGGKKAPMNAMQISAMNKAYNQQAQQEQYESARVAAADKGLTNKVKGTKSKLPTNAYVPGQTGFNSVVRTAGQPQGNQQQMPQQQAFQGNINPYAQYADSVPRTGGFGGQQSQPSFMPSPPFGTNASPWGGGQQQSPYGSYGQQQMNLPDQRYNVGNLTVIPENESGRYGGGQQPTVNPGKSQMEDFPIVIDDGPYSDKYDPDGRRKVAPPKGSPGMVHNRLFSAGSEQQNQQTFPFSGNQNVPQSTFTAQYGNMNGGYSSQPNYGQRDAFIQNINDATAGYQANQGTYLGQGAPPPTWGQAPQYNIPQMWQQAGDMVSNGWQNPLSGLFQQ